MRVAIATEGDGVAHHFGRCASYTFAEVENGKVLGYTGWPNPGHEPGVLPGLLAQQGVQCIVAGGMGPRAIGLFKKHGITTILGIDGAVIEVAEQFARGELAPGESWCEHGAGPGSSHCDHARAPE